MDAKLEKRAVDIGHQIARRKFDQRSQGRGRRNVEIHLSEVELAALVAMGALVALTDKK